MGATRPVEERVKDCLAKHPDWNDDRVRNAIFGSTLELIKAIRQGENVPVTSPEKRVRMDSTAGTISLNAVKKRYDIAAAIREELERLRPGSLVSEREMCIRTAGKDRNRFKRTVDNTEDFAANRVKLRLEEDGEGQWYWGSANDVAEARRLRDE